MSLLKSAACLKQPQSCITPVLYRPGPLAELCLGHGDLEIKSDVQEGFSLERGFMETQDGDGEAVSSQGASHQEMMLPPGPFLGNMDGIALVQML